MSQYDTEAVQDLKIVIPLSPDSTVVRFFRAVPLRAKCTVAFFRQMRARPF
jgi:hypothetical protein